MSKWVNNCEKEVNMGDKISANKVALDMLLTIYKSLK